MSNNNESKCGNGSSKTNDKGIKFALCYKLGLVFRLFFNRICAIYIDAFETFEPKWRIPILISIILSSLPFAYILYNVLVIITKIKSML